jgi:hypothetical protein
MKISLIVSLLLAVCNASASEFQDADSVPKEKQPANFEGARDATFQLGEGCSGTFISNDGYILTAGHCLRAANYQATPVPGLSAVITNYPASPGVNKMRLYTAVRGKPDLSGTLGRLVALGKGSVKEAQITKFVSENIEATLQLAEDGFLGAEDFAILKIDSEKPTACLQIQLADVKPGQEVWSISFPGRDENIKGRPFWKSRSGAFSTGTVLSGMQDNQGLKTAPLTTAEKDAYATIINLGFKDGFLSSLDVLGGSSGASILNSRGEIVGLNIQAAQFLLPVEDGYVFGSNKATTLSSIYNKLKQRLPEETFKAIFSCKN